MLNPLEEWRSRLIFQGKSMIRLLPIILVLGLVFAVDKEGKEKTKFNVTGIVLGENGEGLKKVKLTIFNEIGKKVESGKTKKSGEFKFKKMKAGNYSIVGEHKEEGEVSVDFSITIQVLYYLIRKSCNFQPVFTLLLVSPKCVGEF